VIVTPNGRNRISIHPEPNQSISSAFSTSNLQFQNEWIRTTPLNNSKIIMSSCPQLRSVYCTGKRFECLSSRTLFAPSLKVYSKGCSDRTTFGPLFTTLLLTTPTYCHRIYRSSDHKYLQCRRCHLSTDDVWASKWRKITHDLNTKHRRLIRLRYSLAQLYKQVALCFGNRGVRQCPTGCLTRGTHPRLNWSITDFATFESKNRSAALCRGVRQCPTGCLTRGTHPTPF
jgi:hypothetical protein